MKLFITGISGLLGQSAARLTNGRFEVSGCYSKSSISINNVRALKLDITDMTSIEQALVDFKPDIILHTAAMTNVDECETNPTAANQTNVEATRNTASIAEKLGAKLVHLSTDQLFDGTSAWMTEEDVPAPLNIYGNTKRLAEQVALEKCPTTLVVRTNFFGWGMPPRTSFSDWIIQGLEQDQKLTMFSDVFYTPILMDHLVDVIIDLVDRGATGIFNVAGSERISKYGFALRTSDMFGYPSNNIQSASVDGFPFKAQRPKDMSLNTEKVSEFLKRPMPTVMEGLEALHELQPNGRHRPSE